MDYLRGLLPNLFRNEIRRGINTLPQAAQRIFPSPDIRRQIRQNPSERDTLDPEWRVRATAAAPTPEDIRRRQDYLTVEERLAYRGNPHLDAMSKEALSKLRQNVAAFLYDSNIEGEAASRRIYSSPGSGFAEEIADRALIDAMRARANAAFQGVNLSSLNPDRLIHPWNHTQKEEYAQRAQKREIRARVGLPIPFNIPPDLFQYVGIMLEAPPAPAAPAQNNAAVIQAQEAAFAAAAAAAGAAPPAAPGLLNYNSLPNNGNVTVSGNDPVDFEEFENNQNLMIVTGADGHRFIYKRSSLLPWIHNQQSQGFALTNPLTGAPLSLPNIRRGRAVVASGGRRHSRRRRHLKHRRRTTSRR